MSKERRSAFDIRTVTEGDGDLLAEVFENSPDGGKIGFAQQFRIDPYVAYETLRGDFAGFVAEADDGEPAGAGFVCFGEARFGGELRPYALLDGLAVRESYRGRGLGKRLAAERVEYAEDRFGDDCVVLAYIQQGNGPSKAVAESWADRFAYEQAMYAVEPLPGEPETNGYEIRDARSDELSLAAERANHFYRSAEMYSPIDPEEVREAGDRSPVEEPVHRYVVALDGDAVVAGAKVADFQQLAWAAVVDLPPELEDADELPPAIPESREIRPQWLADLWYADGHEAAGRGLLDWVRANAGGANRIMLQYDRSGPVADVVDVDEEFMSYSTAIRGVADPRENRFASVLI